jgi:hypothetical protein
MLLNYRAVQPGGCRIALYGFRQNFVDSVGSVLFASHVADGATASLACRNDTQTALRIDDSCTCQPINPSGEGCTRTTRDAFVTLPSGPAPFLVKTTPDASKPWTRSYAPATGHYRCSAVPGDVCWLNMAAMWMCNIEMNGFRYEMDESLKSVTLTSVVPHANLTLSSCPETNYPEQQTVIQCDRSCACGLDDASENALYSSESACHEWSASKFGESASMRVQGTAALVLSLWLSPYFLL